MSHQPFEDWLLNETPITPEQKRELDAHVLSCEYCAALLETGVVLRSVKMVAPAEGFTARFQTRLAEQKLAEKRRRVWGSILFLVFGLGLLGAYIGPPVASVLSSPESWVATLVSWGIFLITTLQAMTQAGEVMLQILPGFMPPFAWMIIVSAFAGFGLIWSVSIWRFTRVPQGV